MTKNQEILRKVAKFLYCVAEGAPATKADFKTCSDLCWLCVPGNKRMDKAEIAEIKSHPWRDKTMTDFDDRNDWKYEVENGDTVLGFKEWLEHKKEADEVSGNAPQA